MNLRSFILIAYVRVEKIDFKLNRDVKNDVEKEMIVMLYLDIPYELKESVKKLGARWEPKFKKWYVEKEENYLDFSHYILQNYSEVYIVRDFIYLVVSSKHCWKCNKETNIIGFSIPKKTILVNRPLFKFEDGKLETDLEEYDYKKFYFKKEDFESEEIFDFEILNLGDCSKKILEFIQSKYNYKLNFSKAINASYYANCCEHCDALQGDNYIFDEFESPFNIKNKEMAKRLEFIKFSLKNDFILYGYNPTITFISNYSDEERVSDIKKYSNFTDSFIEIDDII